MERWEVHSSYYKVGTPKVCTCSKVQRPLGHVPHDLNHAVPAWHASKMTNCIPHPFSLLSLSFQHTNINYWEKVNWRWMWEPRGGHQWVGHVWSVKWSRPIGIAQSNHIYPPPLSTTTLQHSNLKKGERARDIGIDLGAWTSVCLSAAYWKWQRFPSSAFVGFVSPSCDVTKASLWSLNTQRW